MHEHIAPFVYYLEVHILCASMLCLAAWALTSIRTSNATWKYWVWVVTSINFLVPLGGFFNGFAASRVSWATQLRGLDDVGIGMSRNLTVAAILLGVWLCGASIMVARLLLCLNRARRAHGASSDIPRRAIEVVPADIPVIVSRIVHAPLVNGLLNPHICLPVGIERVLNQSELDAVLIHEVAHARRRDNLIGLIHEIALCLLWFNPFVWLAGSRMAIFRELSCDDCVIERAQGSDLVCAIAKLAVPAESGRLSAGAASFFSDRVARLKAAPARRAWHGTEVLLMVSFSVVLLFCTYETIAHTPACFKVVMPKSESSPRKQQVVGIRAQDGTLLQATYFAAARPGPGVLLLHQSNRNRESWSREAAQLALAGINTLTLDMRGYGGSAGKREDSKRIPDDVDAALGYLMSQPGVRSQPIGVGGAGWLGVLYSVEAARRHPNEIQSLVLMSGETFRDGLQYLRQASRLPELFVFSDEDEYPPTQDAMKLLYITASNPGKRLVHYSAAQDAPWIWYETSDPSKVPAHGSHGTDLFGAHPELAGIVVQWLVTTLIRTPGHAMPDALSAASLLNQLQTPGGAQQVHQQLLAARKVDPQAQLWPEATADIIGEDYQRAGDLQDAIAVFQLNLLAYPTSADAHSNLADALLADGQGALALQYARKALDLLDAHESPLSSWSDTSQRRAEIRGSVQQTIEKAVALR